MDGEPRIGGKTRMIEPDPRLPVNPRLSPTTRNTHYVRLLAQGAGNRQIAEQLVISQGTVKSHVHHILRKLDAHSRSEAAARARDLRLV